MARVFGSHLSIAGGLVNALDEAARLGFDTVQIFTKNQRQWRVKPLADDAAQAWRARQRELGWDDGRTVAHDAYLINLASPDDAQWERSIDLMRVEFERCAALGICLLVSHPGSHMGSGVEAGIERIAQAYERILPEFRSAEVVLCLENTAGGGATLGRSFEELAAIRRRIVARAGRWAKDRVAFCLDTCHMLAAGLDIRTAAGMRAALDRFDRLCGLSRLRVWHLNDSKGALGSHVDRHTHIGDGQVGKEAFAVIVQDGRFERVPKILETPKGQTPKGTPWDRVNLRRLRRLQQARSASGKRRLAPSPREPLRAVSR